MTLGAYYIFPIILVSLVNYCLVVSVNNQSDTYEAKKNATIKHPDHTSKKENGKLAIPVLRDLLGHAIQFITALLAPLKLGIHGVTSIAAIVPETLGLDTNHSFFSGILTDFQARAQLIAPGTKWCGPGNVAKDVTDLGKSKGDECCRKHDLCPRNILAGETKYGLKNSGLFTRSDCSCDKDFYNCLKKTDTSLSRDLGVSYFNLLGPQCFELVDCSDRSIKCRSHQKRGKEYQWSDNPKY